MVRRPYILLVLTLLIGSLSAHAQSEAEAGDALFLQQPRDTNRTATIVTGQPMRAWTTDGARITGKLRAVTDSSFTLDTLPPIAIAHTVKVRAYDRNLGADKMEKLAWGSLWPIGVAVLLVILGGLLVLTGAQFALGVLLLLLGGSVGGIALLVLFFALVVLINGNTPATSFRLGKDWRLKPLDRKR